MSSRLCCDLYGSRVTAARGREPLCRLVLGWGFSELFHPFAGRIASLTPVLLALWSFACNGKRPTDPTLNPTPVILALQPDIVPVGSPAIVLTVTGSDFLATSIVRWNGSDRPTTHVSATQLTAQIPEADLAAVAMAAVTVFTPGPGGGTSSALTFTIRAPISLVDTIPGDPSLDGWSNGVSYGVFGFPVRTGDYDNAFGGIEAPPYRQFFGFQLPARRVDLQFDAATLVLDQCVALGNPFAEGPVVVDHLDYGSMISLAAYDQPPLAAAFGTLSSDAAPGYRTVDVTASVLADWAAVRGRSEFRVRFAGAHVGNGAQDFIAFRDANDLACPEYPGIGGAAAPDRKPRLLLAYSY